MEKLGKTSESGGEPENRSWLRDKARRLGFMASLGAAVVAGGVTPDVEAAQPAEAVARSAEDVGQKTESSAWAQEIVQSARNDLSKIKTAEEVEWWSKKHVRGFITEFYFPTKGKLVDATHGLKARRETPREALFIKNQLTALGATYVELSKKFGIAIPPNITGQIKDMDNRLQEMQSYSFQEQRNTLDKAEEFLKGKGL